MPWSNTNFAKNGYAETVQNLNRPERRVWLYDPKFKSTFLDKSGHVLIM